MAAHGRVSAVGAQAPDATLFDYALEDFELVGYEPYPAIQAPVAV